jgi:hypothetical protein
MGHITPATKIILLLLLLMSFTLTILVIALISGTQNTIQQCRKAQDDFSYLISRLVLLLEYCHRLDSGFQPSVIVAHVNEIFGALKKQYHHSIIVDESIEQRYQPQYNFAEQMNFSHLIHHYDTYYNGDIGANSGGGDCTEERGKYHYYHPHHQQQQQQQRMNNFTTVDTTIAAPSQDNADYFIVLNHMIRAASDMTLTYDKNNVVDSKYPPV